MQLFYISDVKTFMNALLKDSAFNGYEARGVSLLTFTRFDISCVRDNSEDSSKVKYCQWSEIQPAVYNLVKGKTPPKFIKIGLCLSGDTAEATVPNTASLHLTITYENGRISVLTGSSQKSFTLDNSADAEWDGRALAFFRENGFQPLESAE